MQTTTEAAEPAARSDHTVTRDDQHDGICATGVPDRSNRVRTLHRGGDLTVTFRAARLNPFECTPDRSLKRRAHEHNRQLFKSRKVPRKV